MESYSNSLYAGATFVDVVNLILIGRYTSVGPGEGMEVEDGQRNKGEDGPG